MTVGAYEADPFAGNWNVTAYAVCANPIPGLVRITATSARDSNDSRFITATCTDGQVLTGAGFEGNGALGEVVVDDFRPNGNTTTAPTKSPRRATRHWRGRRHGHTRRGRR